MGKVSGSNGQTKISLGSLTSLNAVRLEIAPTARAVGDGAARVPTAPYSDALIRRGSCWVRIIPLLQVL